MAKKAVRTARKFTSAGVSSLLRRIRGNLAEADRECNAWSSREDWAVAHEKETAESSIQSAFELSLFLMETLGLPKAHRRIQTIYSEAMPNLIETRYSVEMAEEYLYWSYRLSQILDGPEIASAIHRRQRSPDGNLRSAILEIVDLCESFQRVALRMQKPRAKHRTFTIKDEYDVQNLLGALLETKFSDIRPEESTPSHAGGAARLDFFLKAQKIAVEAKMTRKGLADHKIGDELILDIERYKKYPNCKGLFCFVYDPDHRLKNPRGLETDLSRKTDGLLVHACIRPIR